MPKKHRQPYLNTKPNYVHSLSSGKRASAEQSAPSSATVNERLSQLRISQASPASADWKRELAELSNQKSLPPSLGQGILGLAPTAAPRPHAGVRSRIRLRTPGPAPPPSWQGRGSSVRQIEDSRYRRVRTGPRSFGKRTSIERTRPVQLARFINLIGENPVRRGTLVHTALKTAAENWEAIAEDCLDDLDYLPLHLRSVLLSYIATCGPPQGIDIHGIKALFPGLTDAVCLDLSGLAGWSCSLKELKRWLTTPPRPGDEEATAMGDNGLAESWEEEVSDAVWAPIPQSLTSRLPFLTKLSLAYPPSSVSWVDLLSLTKDLGTLTHLSLAYWPIPTRTPNMKSATYVTRTNVEQAASATTIYSASDKDFQESSLILRQLSEQTYCLQWLDLQGCSDWLPALISQGTVQQQQHQDGGDPEWSQRQDKLQGPNWRGPWRNITYLNMSQDWTPAPSEHAFMNSAAFKGRIVSRYFALSALHLQIIQDLKETAAATGEKTTLPQLTPHCEACHSLRDGSGDADCRVCTASYDHATARLARWLEKEAEAWAVGRSINLARAGGSGAHCTFDHGWRTRETYPVHGRTF